MTIPKFLLKKSTYVILAIVLAGTGWFLYSRSKSTAATYETEAAVKQDLVQTVQVTGEIKPLERIELAFKQSGTIADINAKVGDKVKAGDVLAELKADDVQFAMRSASSALLVAQANLTQKTAGETSQTIRVAETQVEQAQASTDKAVADLASAKQTTQDALSGAEIALETAQNNLQNQDAIVSQNVQNAYDSAVSQLRTALGPLSTGLGDGDQFSGVDNSAASAAIGNVLGFLDAGSVDRSKISYASAKSAKNAAETAVNALTSQSPAADIQAAAAKLQTAIALVQAYLTDIQKVLAATLTSSSLTASDLAAKKTVIDTDRTSVSAQNTSVLSALQGIKNAELTKNQTIQNLRDALKTAQTSYATARTNADVQVRAAETTITIQTAALDSAKATLDLKRSPVRQSDLAPLRAAVDQAEVALEKARNDLQNVQVIAPVDGVISDVLPSVGEQVAPNVAQVMMIGTARFNIEALVPEADIAKVSPGQTTVITLDAFGDDLKFFGTVTAENPDQTKVQDAVYYKVTIEVDPAGRDVKPGMTANVTVQTGERKGTLVVPLRAIRTKTDGTKTVRVLVNGVPQERTIAIGLKGDEGLVEIMSGVNEGDRVIVGETTTAAPSGG